MEEWNQIIREDIYDAIIADDLDTVKLILDRIVNLTQENLKFVDDLLVFAVGQNRLKTVKLLIECYNASININNQSISLLLNSNKVGFCLKQYMLSVESGETDCNCE